MEIWCTVRYDGLCYVVQAFFPELYADVASAGTLPALEATPGLVAKVCHAWATEMQSTDPDDHFLMDTLAHRGVEMGLVQDVFY